MTTQQKQLWKQLGVLITAGIFTIGVIFGAGKLVASNANDHIQIIEHGVKLQDQEARIQTLETAKAVQETDSKNMKQSIDRIERNTEETNKLIQALLKERAK